MASCRGVDCFCTDWHHRAIYQTTGIEFRVSTRAKYLVLRDLFSVDMAYLQHPLAVVRIYFWAIYFFLEL